MKPHFASRAGSEPGILNRPLPATGRAKPFALLLKYRTGIDMTEKLLIVEDEDTLRESLKRVLTSEGYAVDGVGSSEEALRLLEENTYDLIITDIILPGIDGIQLLKKCREKNPQVKVIIITAFASIETAVEAIRSGAFDYLVKPIMHHEINDVIRKALQA